MEEEQQVRQTKYKTEKKPQWSLDVKIIAGIDDFLQAAGQAAVSLELGNEQKYKELKAYLKEAYMQMGGSSVTGTFLEPESQKAIEKYFDEVDKTELMAMNSDEQRGQLTPEQYDYINKILVTIRMLLYAERNRNFVKFMTIHSRAEIAEEQALGRG